jgi:hypothetical protein
MTLIITTLADDAVTQTSDLKLTWPDGSVFEDTSIKSTIVVCRDAKFIVGYTGLAMIGNVRTDHWLVEHFSDTRAGHKELREVLEGLRLYAASTSSSIQNLGDGRKITFIFAGFFRYRHFFAFVTNYEDRQGRRLQTVNDAFEIHSFVRDETPVTKLTLIINGAEKALNPNLRSALPKIQKRFLHLTPEDRTNICVEITRRASSPEPRKAGWRIGRDCIGTTLTREGESVSRYYPDRASPAWYEPHFVGPLFTLRDGFTTTDEQAAAKERERILAKLPFGKKCV